jgi:hypothetical protein
VGARPLISPAASATAFAKRGLLAVASGWKQHKKRALTVLVVPALALALGGCSVGQILTDVGHVIEAVGTIITVVAKVEAAPPASDLADFDASKATEQFNLQNMSLQPSSGDATIKVTDQSSGDILGEQQFAYTVNNAGQLNFTHPASVTSWVRSFSTYSGYVNLEVSAHIKALAPNGVQTGTVHSTFDYEGTPWASSMLTIHIPRINPCPGHHPACHPR